MLTARLQEELLSVFLYVSVEEICGHFIPGGGCGRAYNPWKQQWTVTFPKPNKPLRSNQPDTQKVSYSHYHA